MKNLITVIILFMSMSVFGQDVKFDIFRDMSIKSTMTVTKTSVVDVNKLDTAYIHVYTNDTSAITIMKNTYLMDRYTVTDGIYKFYFPKKSSARIMTNLEGGHIKYSVSKYIEEK